MSANRPIPPNPELTGIAVAAPVPGMIAEEVCPSVSVGAEAYKWTEYPIEQGLTVPDTKVGRLGRVAQVEFGGEERDGSVDDHGLEDPIPATDKTTGSNIDPRNLATEKTSQLVTLARELRVRDLYFTASNYANGNVTTYGAGEGFYNPETNVLEEFEEAQESSVVDYNALVLGKDVWKYIRRNPFMVKAARPANTSGEGRLSIDEVRELLEIDNIIIGKAQVNVAKKGQGASLRRAWSAHCSLVFLERVVKSTETYTFASTFRLTDKQTWEIPDANIGLQGGIKIRVGERLKEQVVAKQAGHLFLNAAVAPPGG